MSTFVHPLLQKIGDKAKKVLNYLVDESSKMVKELMTNLVKEAANQVVEWVSNVLQSTIDSLADQVKASLLIDPLAATTPKASSKALNAEDPEEEFFDCLPLDETSAKKCFGDMAAFPAMETPLSKIQESNPPASMQALLAPAA